MKTTLVITSLCLCIWSVGAYAKNHTAYGWSFYAPQFDNVSNFQSPQAGDIVFDTNSSSFEAYNGSSWNSFAGTVNWATPGTIGSTTPNTGAFTTLSATGAFTPSGGIVGVTNGSNATAGNVGEYVESNVTTFTTAGASNAWVDCTSLSLTAGDWDVTAAAYLTRNGGTMDAFDIGISTTSGNSGAGLTTPVNQLEFPPSTAINDTSGSIPSYRVNVSTTTTYYLKLQTGYSGATPKYTCAFHARRVR